MKTKHTPGPWRAHSNLQMKHDGFSHVISSDHPSVGSWSIAMIGTHDGIEYATANAQLIAAAPDLLNACKAMLEAWECRCESAGIVKIQEAIKKAEGGEG